jgi:protoheme IX farnesyltransferase
MRGENTLLRSPHPLCHEEGQQGTCGVEIGLGRSLGTLLKAGRWRLCFAVALSAASAALLRRPVWDGRPAMVFTGALLFALACTWFNQVQERQRDSLMRRTGERPLAKRELPVPYALSWAALCFIASLPSLVACGGWPSLGILAAVFLLYNGLYTVLKGRSLLALLPGAAAGAAPPVLGWVCGGGPLWHPASLTLFLLFVLWQIPHFWLVAERSSPDYEQAGLPVPWHLFGEGIYGLIFALWVGALGVTLLALPALGFVRSVAAQAGTVLAAVGVLAAPFFPALRSRHLFHVVNLAMASVCVVFVAESLFRG